MTTERQRAAVKFCEEYGFPRFTGDIENFNQVSEYLSRYLNEAKELRNKQAALDMWEDFMMNCGDIGIESTY